MGVHHQSGRRTGHTRCLFKAPIRSHSSDRLVRVPREGWVDRSGSRHEAGITLSQAQPLRGTPTSCVYHCTRKRCYTSARFKTVLRCRFSSVQFSLGLISRTSLRQVARLGAFWEQASELGDDPRAKAYSTKFLLGTGDVTTAGDVVQKYRLWEISDAFFNRVRYSRSD
jgi:hypothetical protein